MSVAAVFVCALVCAVAPAGAMADAWFPHPAGAQWTYHWADTTYNPQGTTEAVTVKSQADPSCGGSWSVAWTGDIRIPISSSSGANGPVFDSPDNGTMCFIDQSGGLVSSYWTGTAPPFTEPPLCSTGGGSSCGNSLGSTMFNLIWGNHFSTVLAEPLLRGTSWTGRGADGSATSFNQYVGMQRVTVPAFPKGVLAAVERSQLALAGTAGDDYGSGNRTTWWVYGVGPVKIVFDHVDGSVTTDELQSTNLKPGVAPPDENYFPMTVGLKNTYSYTNSRHLRQPAIEAVSVAAAANGSARMMVKSVRGPIRAAGQYIFSLRLDGLRSTYGVTSAATLAKFPRLGHRRHFFNPLDLMTYGFSPVLPAYPVRGTSWKSGNRYDLQVYGVKGRTWVVGVRSVRVPAGRFKALEVKSVLRQRGYPYGSGTRTMWFATGRGLVKLVFRHRDGSVSLVQLLK